MADQPANVTSDGRVVQSKYDRISQENQSSSYLLRLPAELRNQIYEHYLFITEKKIHYPWRYQSRCASQQRGLSVLSRVCRQTRTELSPMFFQRTVLFFMELEEIKTFARVHSQEHRKCIKELVVSEELVLDMIVLDLFDFDDSDERMFPSLEIVIVTCDLNEKGVDRECARAMFLRHFKKGDLEIGFVVNCCCCTF